MNENQFSLGDLSNPKKYHGPVSVNDFPSEYYINALKKMILIRKVEEKLADNIENGTIKCPCHLSIGQEAIPVGISQFLTDKDYIYGNHRSHGHYLALGGSAYKLIAEVLGKMDGCSNGMGGSMHLTSLNNGFIGSVPIVAGTIPIALGSAFASKIKMENSIAVSYFGDGATEEGVFHESLNFASQYNAPILFVCENNMFSSHMHISERQKYDSLSRFAKVSGIPLSLIDGNDVNEIFKAAKLAIEKIREGNGPYFIEMVTYRWRAHVGYMKDLEIGLHRRENYKHWLKRDPISRLYKGLNNANMITKDIYKDLISKTTNEVNGYWQKALKANYPPAEQLSDTVYFN